MTVHAGDVALVVQEALGASESVGDLSLIATPNPTLGFPNRDGRYEYVCAGRDCVRGFHVTVEAIPFADVDQIAHPEQYPPTDGKTSHDIETLLAGLGVESIAALKELVDMYHRFERTVAAHETSLRGGVSSEASRGAARRQPHGCEGQLQQ